MSQPPALPNIIPEGKHNGVIVYLSRPNRYEIQNNRLLAGPPGDFLKDTLRANDVDPDACIYTLDPLAFRGGYGVRIALGEYMQAMLSPNKHLLFNEERGYIHKTEHGPLISTFAPVDCVEVVSHEIDYADDDDDADDKAGANKDSAPTRRSNFRFWFGADLNKILQPEQRRSKATYRYNTKRFVTTDELVSWLNSLKDTSLYLDIETHPPTNTVQCMTLMATGSPAFMVPVYDYTKHCKHHLPKLFAALARAFKRNQVVGHNIMFDLGFLFHYHGVPFGTNIYDTMLAQHRAFPEAEKSLAHTMSYWCNAPYHKDSAGTFTPYNHAQYEQLLEYNARDVMVLEPVHINQMASARKMAGLLDSITQVMDTIYPYLVASFTGFVVNTSKQKDTIAKTTKLSTSLTRVIRILVGDPEFNPASAQQVGRWLYEGLHYPVLSTTEKGAPSTDMKTLYQLVIKFPTNVALKLLIYYKVQSKIESMMSYEPYYINEFRPAK